MIKRFCDTCSTEIQDDDREFSIVITENSRNEQPYRQEVQLTSGKWVNPAQAIPMVCVHCIMDVVKLLFSKPQA